MLLQELAPAIAAEVDFMNNVVIIGPETCPRCDRTAKLLDTKGIKWVKAVVEDKEHPLVVALKKHLGIPTGFVNMPMVFVHGEFRWHDMNAFAISELAKAYDLVA
ncbi:MAG: glutaredoxin domain-containing protein [Candidatus Saccharimonadales bacterium]